MRQKHYIQGYIQDLRRNCTNIILSVSLYSYKLGNPALPRLLIVTPAVYPHLYDFTRKPNFKADPNLK